VGGCGIIGRRDLHANFFGGKPQTKRRRGKIILKKSRTKLFGGGGGCWYWGQGVA